MTSFAFYFFTPVKFSKESCQEVEKIERGETQIKPSAISQQDFVTCLIVLKLNAHWKLFFDFRYCGN